MGDELFLARILSQVLNLARRVARNYDPRWSFFRTLPAQGRVLEIGCGRSENCVALHALFPELEIHGLDLLPPSEVPAIVHYIQHDLEITPLPYCDKYFDAILFVHVIEHLRDPSSLCGEIKRLMREGAQIYVETPNFTSIFVPSFGFLRRQHHPLNFFDDLGHQRPFSKQALYEFIENCGLNVKKVANTRNWLRIPVDLVGFPLGLIKGDRPQVVRHFWNLWGWCIYGVGQKG